MALFQQTVLKKYLTLLNDDIVCAAYEQYKIYFLNTEIQDNIRNSKEEQFQEGFLRELFVKVLGYTLNPSPNYNLITEQKNISNAKKADGAILVDGEVVGIIELKDGKTTDLTKVEQQAFGYKNQHPKAVYVIISNFEKLRFYINNTIEFQEFDLFSLTLDDFKLLYLLIAYHQIENNIPKKVKEESLSTEDTITQTLYKDYSTFKRTIFADILENNVVTSIEDKILLFKKSQKLLDRLLFIFFAEDFGLLSPNTTIRILSDWEKLKELDAYTPLYERIKKYFNWLNEGYKGKDFEVFAYNGGLFKPDEVLDNLTISDDILFKHTKQLCQYDYASEVDVNILGHIFENSLTEIEEITNQLQEGAEPTISKRKKDGVFYTPQYITKYIVENTVGKLCSNKKEELGIVEEDYFSDKKRQTSTKKSLLDKLETYREWLKGITICDPACGSGAFLSAALQFLKSEHQLINEMQAKVTGGGIAFAYFDNDILENNLYGVDINEESIEIAKLALWLRTAQPFRKLSSLNKNIKCGNSLISDPTIAGEKAFNWEKEFPEVFEKGGFDIIIGNPPYINVEHIPTIDKEYYKQNYQSFFKRSDIFTLFVEKGLCNISKKHGKIAFIIPSIVLNNLSYQPLRNLFLDNCWLQEVSYVGGAVFSDATVDTSILIFDKVGNEKITLKHAVKFFEPTIQVVSSDYFKTFNNVISIGEEESGQITDKLFLSDYVSIEECFNVFQGIVTGNNDAFIFETEKDATEKGIEKELLHTLCHGRDIGKWGTRNLERKILYVDKHTNLIDCYNGAFNWLSSFKGTLMSRRECIKNVIPWYALQWARIKSELDVQEKILIQNTRNESLKTRIVATIDKQGAYASQGINIIIPKSENYSIYFLLALLNSKLMNYLFSKKFLNLAIKAEYLKQVRFPNLSIEEQKPLIDLADKMLSLHSTLQTKRNRFLHRLQENMPDIKINGTLENFDLYDFPKFVSELKKQKIKLTLVQQDEWEEYFNHYKQECNALVNEITAADSKIDELVYQLYNLTEEEIKVVENI